MYRRTGVSWVGVLLALVIVALLGALLLTGVNRVRDAAARAKSQNNLKQLALAVHNYNDAYQGKLPMLTDQGEGARTGQGVLSIFATLSPYIESGPRYYDPQRDPPAKYHAHSSVVFTYRHKDNTTFTDTGGMANRAWWVLTDPGDTTADSVRDVPMTLPDGTTGYYATGSYAANGLIPWGTGGVPKGFPDGTANTILFAERPQVCRTAAGETVYNLWGLGFYSPHMPAFAALTPAEPPGLLSTGQVAAVEPLPDKNAGDRDGRIRVRVGRHDATTQSPDFRTPVQLLRGAGPCDPRLPGSSHATGMNVAMADGSVRLFAPDVTPWIFWAACTPAGAKTVTTDLHSRGVSAAVGSHAKNSRAIGRFTHLEYAPAIRQGEDTAMTQTVMVVEDHGATRDGVAAILRDNGYGVVALENGRQALDRLSTGPPPDLILLDMLLPVLDGWRLLELLKESPHGNVPVIITTGTILTREWAASKGCAGFLKKPIDPAEMVAEVRRVLDG